MKESCGAASEHGVSLPWSVRSGSLFQVLGASCRLRSCRASPCASAYVCKSSWESRPCAPHCVGCPPEWLRSTCRWSPVPPNSCSGHAGRPDDVLCAPAGQVKHGPVSTLTYSMEHVGRKGTHSLLTSCLGYRVKTPPYILMCGTSIRCLKSQIKV